MRATYISIAPDTTIVSVKALQSTTAKVHLRRPASGSATTNSFAYTGRELDAGNLYFYRARYYNPSLQRFVSEDPLRFAGGIHLYAYTEGNPINFTDPFGKNKNGPKLIRLLRKIGEHIPVMCGGGVFNYGGVRVSGGVASVSLNQIRMADRRTGYSEDPFTDLTIGEGLQGGVGYASFTGGGNETFLFGVVGGDVGVISVGVSGFVPHASGDSILHNSIGINGDAGIPYLGGGVGVYLNTDSLTSCVDNGFH